MPKGGPGIPPGKWPTTRSLPSGTEVIDVRCPNGHAAGNGHITPPLLGIATCPTDGAILVLAAGASFGQ